MKRLIFSLCALMLVAAADAQVRRGNMITERTKIGIQGGLSVASQTFATLDGDWSSNPRYGGLAGVSLEVPIKNGLYFQPELNYVNMGSRYVGEASLENGQKVNNAKLVDNFNYVQLPLMLKYRPLYSGFGIFGGPQVGLLTHMNSEAPGVGNKKDFTNLYKKYDIGGLVGVEYYFPNADDRAPQFGLGLRAQIGFTDVNGPSESSYASRRNNGIQLTAGVRF